MTLGQLARFLGLASRTVRDVNAVQRGRVGQRIYNRAIGRANSKMMRRFWK